jgi:hypothetical protein
MDLNDKNVEPPNSKNLTSLNNDFSDIIFNPIIIIIVFVIIVLIFSFSSSLGNNKDDFVFGETPNSNGSTLLSIIIGIVIIYVLIKIIEFIYNIDVSTKFYDFDTDKAKIDLNFNDDTNDTNDTNDINDDKDPSALTKISDYLESKKDKYSTKLSNKLNSDKQVFNIPGNNYDYNTAKALCKAYDADLATYSQVEDSYEKGGEWCNYGWSEGQMALFPTQQASYDSLQKIEGHENDCGRPGINGGYIANPNVQFGANCYGIKPLIRQEENDLMKTMTPYPETEKDREFQRQVNALKNKVNEILVSPFNYKSWTQA